MTFTSLTFLIFLAIVFTLYWSVRTRRGQNLVLIAAGYVFYGWWDWRFCLLMVAASFLDFFVGLGLNGTEDPRRRKLLLLTAISGNVGMLGFFKYFNFFGENFQALASSIGWHVDPVTVKVVLPVGISFYTFQTMSYSIDIYRRKMRATTHLTEYLAFVSFFPQLVAGPIERATHLLPQFFRDRVFSDEQARSGCKQALWGFFKKMVIADNLSPIVDAAFSNPSGYNGCEMALATFAFAWQIYCDFSGYSDIAIGTGRLFGFELVRNFAYPYFSQSVAEFWRRWHISLTTWFKDYVYFPLGGSRVPRPRMALNVMITFLLSGLWHGASWNFIIWGGLNGLGVLPEILRRHSRRTPSEVPAENPTAVTFLKMGATFAFVCLGWIFFRAPTLAAAVEAITRIATAPTAMAGGLLAHADGTDGRVWLALGVLIVAEWVQRRNWHALVFVRWPVPARWAAYTAVAWAVLALGTYGSSPFIYFQF